MTTLVMRQSINKVDHLLQVRSQDALLLQNNVNAGVKRVCSSQPVLSAIKTQVFPLRSLVLTEISKFSYTTGLSVPFCKKVCT